MVEQMRDIPPAEFEVMEVLWSMKEANVRQVRAALAPRKKLAYTTVATLLIRLKAKGYVSARESNFAWLYTPVVDKDEVVRQKLRGVFAMLFENDHEPLAAFVAEAGQLSAEQIGILRRFAASMKGAKEDEHTRRGSAPD